MIHEFSPRYPTVHGIGGRYVELLEPHRYLDEHRGLSVVVPAGFVSNGASVPRWCWGALRAGWVELLAFALLHDYLYRVDAVVRDLGREHAVPGRGWADTVGVESMGVSGCSARDRRFVRVGLFLGGRGSWHQKNVEWRP